MARVFTTEFELDHQQYKALVVIRESMAQLSVCIRFFDTSVIEILGNDSIEFVGLSGYKHLNHFQHPAPKALIEAVGNTILNYLSNTKR